MSRLRRVLSCTSCFGNGSIRRLPRRHALHVDRAVARDDDDVYRQADDAVWNSEAWTERDSQPDRLQEHRGRRSSGRLTTLASQESGEPRDIGLLNVGFGDADTLIRPQHRDDAFLAVEPDAALRKREPRQRPYLRLPSIRWPIDRNAEADDNAFRAALSVSAHRHSGDDGR